MAEPFYHNVVINLHIVKHNDFYFYTRRENGRTIIDAQRINAERATGIMRLNEDDPAVSVSQRQTEEGFSWIADIVVQVEDATA